MRKMNFLKMLIIFILTVSCPVIDALAQSPQQIDQWIIQLQSQDWREREVAAFALNELPSALITDSIKEALIKELEREYTKISKGDFEKCAECDDGGEEGYYSWLFETVAKMKDDRAFPLFLRIGSPYALMKYGDRGVEAVLENLKNKTTCNEKYSSIRILTETLQQKEQGYVASGAIRESIKKIIHKTWEESKHPDKNVAWYEQRAAECASVRVQIIRAFGYLAEAGDSEVIPLIQAIAGEDPYVLDMSKKKDYKGPLKVHPVREEAEKALKKIKEKEKK